MARRRRAGRRTTLRAVGRVVGRVPAGRSVGRVRPIERARTAVAPMSEPVTPVFSDSTGARRRRVRRWSYAAGLLLALLLIGFWLSQLGFGAHLGLPAPAPGGFLR